jgi:hypothetical protein
MNVSYATAVTAALACLWMGLLLGVSFLATLAKFKAPTLTRPVALDVGRHTFLWLARAEWAVAACVALALLGSGFPPLATAAFAGLAVVSAASAFWIAPRLYARADAIIAGRTPAPSSIHGVAVLVEMLKLVLLFVMAVASFHALLFPLVPA